jgi:hypothetical protein
VAHRRRGIELFFNFQKRQQLPAPYMVGLEVARTRTETTHRTMGDLNKPADLAPYWD